MKFAASIWTVLTAIPLMAQSVTAPQEPTQYFSLGGGVVGLGPSQPFGYFSASQRIATGTYATQISEFYRMKGGNVGQSVRAGISKVLWSISNVTIGIVGDAGAAEGATGSASGSFSGRGYLDVRFGKSPFGIVGTAQTLQIAGTGQQMTVTLGFRMSK